MGRIARRTEVTECRQCLTYCDRMIAPATCVAAHCPALYTYDDPLSGNRYMGCASNVFATEIDVKLFEEAERGRGYGMLKLAREPTARCEFSVDAALMSAEEVQQVADRFRALNLIPVDIRVASTVWHPSA